MEVSAERARASANISTTVLQSYSLKFRDVVVYWHVEGLECQRDPPPDCTEVDSILGVMDEPRALLDTF